MPDDLNEMIEIGEDEQERFTVNDDVSAEWAMHKVQEKRAEYNRLTSTCRAWAKRYEEKAGEYERACERETSYLKGLLEAYFDQVPHKRGKTQESYALPCGKLVRKTPAPAWDRDTQALLDWLRSDPDLREDYIKTVEEPKWAELKKELVAHGDEAVYTPTGEFVPGIKIVPRPATFHVEVTEDE